MNLSQYLFIHDYFLFCSTASARRGSVASSIECHVCPHSFNKSESYRITISTVKVQYTTLWFYFSRFCNYSENWLYVVPRILICKARTDLSLFAVIIVDFCVLLWVPFLWRTTLNVISLTTGCYSCEWSPRVVVCCKHFTSDIATFPWKWDTTSAGNVVMLTSFTSTFNHKTFWTLS